MKRSDLVIPIGYIGLEDAFQQAFEALERAEELAKAVMREVSLFSPQLSLEALHLTEITLEKSRRVGLDPIAVKADEDARRRTEVLLRGALREGDLKAFAYGPDGQTWGEIPDRDPWQRQSSMIPGLETFIDPDMSPGPDVNGSPVFLSKTAFQKWLKQQVRERSDPRVRKGTRGCPSAMPLIEEEFNRRCLYGDVKPELGLGVKARELRRWFEENYPLTSPPALSTVRNRIRDRFNALRNSKK
jgi:hypothetical protein